MVVKNEALLRRANIKKIMQFNLPLDKLLRFELKSNQCNANLSNFYVQKLKYKFNAKFLEDLTI